MAEVFEPVIRIDTGDSELTVKDLKKEISTLRDEILNLEKGTEQYDTAVKRLQDDQRKLDEVMALTKRTATALDGSYDALTQQMSLLKKEWRATNDEAKRSELAKKIAEINNELKEMDAEIGNFQRNVGNYVSHWDGMGDAVGDFGDRMRNMQDSIEPTIQKFESVQKISAGLASGFAAVQGAAALLGKENEKLEETFIKLQAAMALAQGFAGIGDLIEGIGKARVAFEGLGKTVQAVTKVIGKTGWLAVIAVVITSLTALIKHISKTSEETERLKQKQEEAKEAQEEWSNSLSKSAGGLLAKFQILSEKWKSLGDDVAKRNKFIKDNQDAFSELGIKLQNIADADKLFIEQTDDFVTAVMKRATAEAYSDRLQKKVDERIALETTAKGNMYNTVVSNGGYTKGNNPFGYFQFTQADIQKAFASEESLRQFYKDYLQYSKEINGEQAPYGDKGKNTWLGTAGNLAEFKVGEEGYNSLEQAIALKENVEKILKLYDDAKSDARAINKIEQELAELLNPLGGSLDDDRNGPKIITKEEALALAQAEIDRVLEEDLAKLDDTIIIDDSTKNPTGYTYQNGDAEKGYGFWNSLIDNETSNAVRRSKLDGGTPEEQDALIIAGEERKLAKLKEFWEQAKSEGDVTGQIALRQQIADQELTIEEEKNRAILESEERTKEKRLKIMGEISNALSAAGSLTQGILEITQAAAEKDGKITEKEAKRIKGMQYATASINMLQGAISAYAAAQTIPPPLGPILGGVNAAAVIAMGTANLMRIKNTDITGEVSSGAMGAVTPSSNVYGTDIPFSYTRNITSASEVDKLNQDTKVYVLESDITNAVNKQKVRVEESSF